MELTEVEMPRGCLSAMCILPFNPSTHRFRQAESCFSKRARPRAERAGGQPLGRLTSGFLHLKALEAPYNPPGKPL